MLHRLRQKKNYTISLLLLRKKILKFSKNTVTVKNIVFLYARRFLNNLILLSGVKVMVLSVMSGKNKGTTFIIIKRYGSGLILLQLFATINVHLYKLNN